MTDDAPEKPKASPWLRAAVDYAAPLAFVVVYLATKDFLAATWGLVAVSALALLVAFILERRIAPVPLLAGGAALIAGVLTLVFKDPVFVKMKPTAVNAILGLVMLGGLAAGKSPLKLMLGDSLKLSEGGWRKLTVRYGLFFLALAALNEAVWRTQPDTVWAVFRFPGLAILALAFSFSQIPTMMKDMKAVMDAAARTTEAES